MDNKVENYSLREIKNSLNYAIDNFDSENKTEQDIAGKVLNKMNLGLADAKSLKWSKERLSIDPSDEDAIRARNNAFTKVASKYSAIKSEGDEGASNWHRFVAKTIPEEDQKRYLEAKGYDVRKMPTGGIQVKKPTDLTYSYLDPYGLDLMDVVDVVPDAIEAGLAFAAEGGIGKVAKNIPLIGKYLAVPGMATAGAIGAGGDIIRQGISLIGGGREAYDPLRTVQQGAIAAGLTGAIKGASKLLPTLSKAQGQIGELTSSQVKANAPEIVAAAKTIGAEATPGMLTKNLTRQNLEDAMARSPDTLVGSLLGESKLKKQIAKNYDAIDKAGAEILSEASVKSTGFTPDVLASRELSKDIANVGTEVRKKIYDTIKPKVDEASKLYNELETVLARPGYKINQGPTNETIAGLMNDYEFDKTATNYLMEQEKILENVKTIADLKKYRTSIMADAARFKQDPNLRRATKEISSSLDRTRDQTFADLIETNLAKSEKNYLESMAQGIIPKKQQSTTTAIFVKEQQDKLAKASRLWREANEDLASVIKRPGEQLKGGINYNLDKLMKTSPEDVFKKVLSSGDTEKAAYLLNKYPKQYVDVLRQSKSEKLQKIVNNLQSNQQRSKSPGFATITSMKSLSNEDKNLLLGADAQKKLDALLTLYREQPRMANASGTAINAGLIKGEYAKMNAEAFGRYIQKKWLDWGGENSKVLDKVINGLNTKKGRAAIQTMKPNVDLIRGEEQ
jgi:hypothetical protein